jgi:ZIP family zinc transporter
VSFAQTILLGLIAGSTIYLGLPVGRCELRDSRIRVALAMFSVGILAFIFVDVLSHGLDIVNTALDNARHDHGSVWRLIWLVVLLGAGFTLGSAGLVFAEQRLKPVGGGLRPQIAGGSGLALPPDALAAEELQAARARALRTGLTVATAIGLHNFAEGLAIGVSARSGAISLATVLIIGFALHNATEGFGIVGPLGGVKPTWRWLGLAGLVGGGPTFLGSLVGYAVTSQALELAFYALAGGAILYVVIEITGAMRRYGHRELALMMVSAGFLIGVITDLVVSYGGA